MTVLVTGGVGYLGARLLRELPTHPQFAGEEIRVLDSFRQPRFNVLWQLPSAADYTFIEGDVRDSDAVAEALDGVDTVFNLAAVTNAPNTFDIPETTWEVNHRAAVDLFAAAKEHDVETFVQASTCSVYGKSDGVLLEGSPCAPESPYAEAKLQAEGDLLDRSDQSIDAYVLRLGTVYGWTTGVRFDTVVNKFSFLAATGQSLTVYEGAERQLHPYVHAHDAVRAMLFAPTGLEADEIYNVVHDNYRLNTIVSEVKAAFSSVSVEHIETERLNQVSYSVSAEKIESAGFETTLSLSDGVTELADKFRNV